MCDILTACTHDRSGTEIPKELASLIALYLPKCYTSTKDAKLIKQARKKLNEAQQEQSSLALTLATNHGRGRGIREYKNNSTDMSHASDDLMNLDVLAGEFIDDLEFVRRSMSKVLASTEDEELIVQTKQLLKSVAVARSQQ